MISIKTKKTALNERGDKNDNTGVGNLTPQDDLKIDVFVSYSRKDKDFANVLDAALRANNYKIWLDRKELQPIEEWLKAIFSGIEAANNFVFVISPDSVVSDACNKELSHAIKHNKRLIPILRRDTSDKDVPQPLATLNYIYMRDVDDFDRALKDLIKAINTDLEYVRAHTRLLVRAIEWDTHQRNKSLMLRGSDLRDAEQWLSQAGDKRETAPSQLQTEYITASRRAEINRQRLMLGTLIVGLITAIALAVLYLSQRNAASDQARIALARHLAAQSDFLRNGSGRLIQLSVLLGVEAHRRFPSQQTDEALRAALDLLPTPVARLKHDSPVIAARFIPNDNLIATCAKDNVVRVWDSASGQELARFDHELEVNVMAFSEDGKYLATGSGNQDSSNPGPGQANVWEWRSQRQVARVEFQFPVRHATFIKGTGYFAFADSATAIVVDPKGMKEKSHITFHNAGSGVKTFSPDGVRLAVAYDRGVDVYDLMTGQIIANLTGPSIEGAQALTFNSDGKYLAKGGATSRVWRLSDGKQIAIKGEPENDAVAIAFSPNDDHIAQIDREGYISVWNPSSGNDLQGPFSDQTQENLGGIKQVIFSPDSLSIVATGGDNTVRYRHLYNGEELLRLVPEANIASIALSSDGRHVIVGDESGWATVWELRGVRDDKIDGIDAALFSPSDRYLATREKDSFKVIEMSQNRELIRWPVEGFIEAVEFSQDEKYVGCLNSKGTIKVWELPSGLEAQELRPDKPVRAFMFVSGKPSILMAGDGVLRELNLSDRRSIKKFDYVGSDRAAFSPGGTYFTVRGSNESTDLFEVSTGRKITTINTSSISPVMVFSKNGAYLASALDEGHIGIWETSTGREVLIIPVNSLASIFSFSPDGMYIVATEGRDVQVWDLSKRQMIARLVHEGGSVKALALSRDSKRLVTTCKDHSAHIWRLPEGEREKVIRTKEPLEGATFSPDDKRLIIFRFQDDPEANITAQFLFLQPEDLINEACRRLTRNISQEEWVSYFKSEPYRKTCPNLP